MTDADLVQPRNGLIRDKILGRRQERPAIGIRTSVGCQPALRRRQHQPRWACGSSLVEAHRTGARCLCSIRPRRRRRGGKNTDRETEACNGVGSNYPHSLRKTTEW